LPALAESLARAIADPPLPPEQRAAKDAAESEWRRRVGWRSV